MYQMYQRKLRMSSINAAVRFSLFSTLQQVALSSVVTLISAYFIASYKIVKTGNSCNRITSPEECAQAARELSLDMLVNDNSFGGQPYTIDDSTHVPFCWHFGIFYYNTNNDASTRNARNACGLMSACICRA